MINIMLDPASQPYHKAHGVIAEAPETQKLVNHFFTNTTRVT